MYRHIFYSILTAVIYSVSFPFTCNFWKQTEIKICLVRKNYFILPISSFCRYGSKIEEQNVDNKANNSISITVLKSRFLDRRPTKQRRRTSQIMGLQSPSTASPIIIYQKILFLLSRLPLFRIIFNIIILVVTVIIVMPVITLPILPQARQHQPCLLRTIEI